jgi:hypothetical protein
MTALQHYGVTMMIMIGQYSVFSFSAAVVNLNQSLLSTFSCKVMLHTNFQRLWFSFHHSF